MLSTDQSDLFCLHPPFLVVHYLQEILLASIFRPNHPTCKTKCMVLICRDLKRSVCVGLSGFCVSGPLSYSIGQILLRLYPGCGRLTILKRVILSTCVSPLIIACGIAPSVYLQTRDVDTVMVCFVLCFTYIAQTCEPCSCQLGNVHPVTGSIHIHPEPFCYSSLSVSH